MKVRDDNDDTSSYRIVGADETDAKKSAISIDSPLAKALLAKKAGDDVVVKVGEETSTLHILSVSYEA